MLESTSLPRPPAPTIEAMMTIESAIMMVWFTPAISVGSAIGSCTFHSSCIEVQPKAWPASTCSLLTWRMPSAVRRTTGGIANTTVARMPGTRPRPKSIAAGIR